jgi:hypothetical protein
MPAIDIIKAIASGEADDNLDGVRSALEARHKWESGVQFHALKVGDAIRLNNTVRPRYLVGAPGEIVDKNLTRVVVRIDQGWLDAHPQAKARWSGRVTCPVSLIEAAS